MTPPPRPPAELLLQFLDGAQAVFALWIGAGLLLAGTVLGRRAAPPTEPIPGPG